MPAHCRAEAVTAEDSEDPADRCHTVRPSVSPAHLCRCPAQKGSPPRAQARSSHVGSVLGRGLKAAALSSCS